MDANETIYNLMQVFYIILVQWLFHLQKME